MSMLDRVEAALEQKRSEAAPVAAVPPKFVPVKGGTWVLSGERNGKPLYIFSYAKKAEDAPTPALKRPKQEFKGEVTIGDFARVEVGDTCLNCGGSGMIFHRKRGQWLKCHQCSDPLAKAGRGTYSSADVEYINARLEAGLPLAARGGWTVSA